MTNITVDLGLKIQDGDLQRIRENLEKMEPADELAIRLEAAEIYEENIIITEIERLGYDYQCFGGRGNDFYVIVKRRLH